MSEESMSSDQVAGSAFDLPRQELIPLFLSGEYNVEGRMPYSSNATLLVTVTDGDKSHRAIYKPHDGERPLWDFPDGLYKREVAMYRLADQLGWNVIPPTALAEGPFGIGSVQAFLNADFTQHYFTLQSAGIGIEDLYRLCVLDLIANNTDRKSGHCLLAEDGHVYGIDHGLAFHQEWKLRTVLWDYVGEEIPSDIMADVERLVNDGPRDDIRKLLNVFEVDALKTRAKAVLTEGHFPDDETEGHRWPWPLV